MDMYIINLLDNGTIRYNYDLRNNRYYETLYAELKKFDSVNTLESLYGFKRFNTTAKG